MGSAQGGTAERGRQPEVDEVGPAPDRQSHSEVRRTINVEAAMVPTMIVLGLVLGRWWRVALLLAAVVWPIIVVSDPAIGASVIPGAALIGVLNAAVGVLVVQGVLWLYRGLAHHAA